MKTIKDLEKRVVQLEKYVLFLLNGSSCVTCGQKAESFEQIKNISETLMCKDCTKVDMDLRGTH